MASLKMKDIKIDDKKMVKLDIWDTVGREIVRKMNKNYIANKNIFAIVFDVRYEEEMDGIYEISYFLNIYHIFIFICYFSQIIYLFI